MNSDECRFLFLCYSFSSGGWIIQSSRFNYSSKEPVEGSLSEESEQHWHSGGGDSTRILWGIPPTNECFESIELNSLYTFPLISFLSSRPFFVLNDAFLFIYFCLSYSNRSWWRIAKRAKPSCAPRRCSTARRRRTTNSTLSPSPAPESPPTSKSFHYHSIAGASGAP